MHEPADRPPSLRERLAEALHCPTCGVEPGAHCLRARVDNRQPHMTRVREADAVLPVVEAETADAAQRYRGVAEGLQVELRAAIKAQGEAERERDQARDAIADERRGRLAAEAAVRRARAVIDEALPDWEDTRAYHRERADRKGYSHDEAVAETSERAIKVMTDVLAALGAEQPEKPRGDMWTVAVQVPTHLPDAMKDGLFTAVADAVSEWEPADRDGWDPYVTGYAEQPKETP